MSKVTPAKIAADMMQTMLKDSQSARSSAVAIKGLDFSDELSDKLMVFAKDMEEKFKILQQKVRAGKTAQTDFAELPGIQRELDWFAEKKVTAKGMERQSVTKANTKGKAKAKAKNKSKAP